MAFVHLPIPRQDNKSVQTMLSLEEKEKRRKKCLGSLANMLVVKLICSVCGPRVVEIIFSFFALLVEISVDNKSENN